MELKQKLVVERESTILAILVSITDVVEWKGNSQVSYEALAGHVIEVGNCVISIDITGISTPFTKEAKEKLWPWKEVEIGSLKFPVNVVDPPPSPTTPASYRQLVSNLRVV